jgi:ABC-type transport system substrate-binding protein
MVISMVAMFSFTGCKTTTTTTETTAAVTTAAATTAAETTAAETTAAETTAAAAAVPLAFSYNPETSKKILADAGYKDVDGDNFVEAPDGSKVALTIIVPSGWSDWMESINVIAKNCQDVGINVKAEYPAYPDYLAGKLNGTFDLMICNDQQISNTPWTYYDWMFQNPIADIATMQNGNYGRYDNKEAFDLVDQLDEVKSDDVEGMKAIISKLEKIQLTDLPLIPLWYNGMWFQAQSSAWTNWPSSAEGSNHYLPVTWRGYWNMTAILMLCDLKPVEGVEAGAGTYPRNETLYTSGTQWGPPGSWNPWNTGGYAMGTFGLCYESLFLFDPLTGEYKPWLADSASWTGDKTYQIKLRQGIKWSDGKDFTAADVKFTFDMAKTAAVGLAPVWKFLDSIDQVDDYTLNFNFSKAEYQEFSWYIYNNPIVPEHIWKNKKVEDITAGANEKPVGTGSYLFKSSDQSKMVWVKNPNWWAISALNLDPKPKYIVDIVNSSNNVGLGLLMQGGIDLSNNMLLGIASLIKNYGLSTYYAEPPYMLSANTAWLLMNLTKKPMDDVAFRRALAFAIDTDTIVNVTYSSIVAKASPTGLLPTWDQYIDKSLLGQ